MRDMFNSISSLMANPWYNQKRKQELTLKKEQVLKARRMEQEIYQQNRLESKVLDEITKACETRLPVIENLTQDMFQALYALNVQHNEESELSPLVRRFNRHILDKVMQSPEYLSMKSICEGREYLSMEAATEFMEKVAENLDKLLADANGNNKALEILETQEKQVEQLLQNLQKLAKKQETNPTPSMEKKLMQAANRLYSKEKQVERLNQMVKDNLLKSNAPEEFVALAIDAASAKAREIQSILLSWGDEAGKSEPSELDLEMVKRVQENQELLEIAKYLGRLKEMIQRKRMNAYAYGCGEKYTLELGNNLSRVLSSELALLASPETTPLFLRKYQRKNLKQYARRERISKGQGDIIVCLDESSSTIGSNAAWGKAVAFALLEIAEINRRSFALIHFSSNNQFKIDLFKPGMYSKKQVFDAAQHFFNGGTDFETPLDQAVDLMKEHGWSKADLVFITDGECEISQQFAEWFTASKAALGFTVTGVLMDQDSPGMEFSLAPFCNEIVRISEIGGERAADLLVGGRA